MHLPSLVLYTSRHCARLLPCRQWEKPDRGTTDLKSTDLFPTIGRMIVQIAQKACCSTYRHFCQSSSFLIGMNKNVCLTSFLRLRTMERCDARSPRPVGCTTCRLDSYVLQHGFNASSCHANSAASLYGCFCSHSTVSVTISLTRRSQF
jgi:hypothetical protein